MEAIMVEPIPLPDDGELVVLRRPGLAEESPLPPNGMIGSHQDSLACPGGVISFFTLAAGWVVTCNQCLFRLELPEKPEGGEEWTYAALREFIARESAEWQAAAGGGAK